MAPIGDAVFATLLMNDAYLPGAMVLGHSLRDRGAKAKLVVLVTIDRVSPEAVSELKTVYDDVIPVQEITNKQPANLYVMGRPELISTFTKIELWRQTQYRRIVYLDADMVMLRAPYELLKMDTAFAAAPDIGWPDCFNSGVMVLNPNMADYYALLALAQRGISFDGADQGLLNMHFRDWDRISFAYNCTPSGNYQYVPAYRHFQSSISGVHFIGKDKPWTLGRENRHNHGVYGELLGRWWSVYDAHYRSQTTAYHSGRSQSATQKVQEYVRGEEARFPPGYSSSQPQPSSQQSTPTIVVHGASASETSAMETPMGDAPSPAERTANEGYKPTPTAQQRKFSAPQIDWRPEREPPPAHSKPEAFNFPSQVYDFTRDTKLFRPPASYPEAPKDMWYQVPPKPKPAEVTKPKSIFPWEGRAPKPTRVFAEPTAPSPPPEPEPEPVQESEVLPSTSASTTTEPEPESVGTPSSMRSPDPWAGFEARSNAWDDIPEIEAYMQALQGPRKAKIQVLHNTAQQSRSPVRRASLKLTDFPTAVERPSLPVTPAPIRRPTFWGDERDEDANLPAAEGVPKQDEWVRRFSSYPVLDFSIANTAHLSPLFARDEDNIVMLKCQYCGKQNPIAKLEELQRKQSEVMADSSQLVSEDTAELPTRERPESESAAAVVKATMQATSPSLKMPKPILKEPKFGIPTRSVDDSEPMLSPTAMRKLNQTESPSGKPSAQQLESTTKEEATNPASKATATV